RRRAARRGGGRRRPAAPGRRGLLAGGRGLPAGGVPPRGPRPARPGRGRLAPRRLAGGPGRRGRVPRAVRVHAVRGAAALRPDRRRVPRGRLPLPPGGAGRPRGGAAGPTAGAPALGRSDLAARGGRRLAAFGLVALLALLGPAPAAADQGAT